MPMHRLTAIASVILILVWFAPNAFSVEKATVEGVVPPTPAPAWDKSHWINADPGNVEGNRDKVIVIDFFQLWCPGCNTFTGPLMQKWQDRFSDEIDTGDLLLLKIHTVFEGHDYQGDRWLRKYLVEKRYNFTGWC